MEFNERLMKLRKQKGLSQEGLGYELRVSRQTVSKWELGETTPEMSKLVAIANLFNVSLDSLVKGENTYTHYENSVHEFKSKTELWGLPLVHINFSGRRGRVKRAKGIIAIGDVATGVVAMGGFAVGIISIGGLALGALSFAGLSLGLLSIGGLSMGGIAVGGCAIGYVAAGGCALGINAIGGTAIARDIAFGDYAKGIITIGNEGEGTAMFTRGSVTVQSFRQAIKEYLPNAKDWVVKLFVKLLA